MERIWERENEMTEKKQIKLGTIEKRVEFLEMQTAEDISNIDKIYKILERLEKRLDLLQPRGILSEKEIDEEIKHLKSMGYHPSPTAFGHEKE